MLNATKRLPIVFHEIIANLFSYCGVDGGGEDWRNL